MAFAAALPVSSAAGQAGALPAHIDDALLEDRARRVLTAFDVPGVAVAIVHAGGPEIVRGYGVRRRGDEAPVDGATIFAVGSNTKVFTAVALGLLVEEGRLRWHDSVARYLPELQIGDSATTAAMNPVDLLAHRTGLGEGAGDLLLFPPSSHTVDEIIRRIRFIRPERGLREGFDYGNLNYVLAGALLERVAREPWAAFVDRRILAPLGMARSGTRLCELPPDGNVASPHARGDAGVQPIACVDVPAAAAAGGMRSTAADMARWVGLLLGRGSLRSGTRQARLYGEALASEIGAPHAVVAPGESKLFGEARDRAAGSYGLGLHVARIRGERMLYHQGAMPGMVSRVTLLPDRGLGVVVLSNQESVAAVDALTNAILDAYLPGPKADWIARSAALERQSLAKEAERATELLRPALSPARRPGPAANYAGRYVDAVYGEALVTALGEDLDIALVPTRAFRARLESLGGDAFAARWGDPVWRNDARVTFHRHPATGEVTRVSLESVSSPDSVAALPLSGLDLRRADDGTADAESRRITH